MDTTPQINPTPSQTTPATPAKTPITSAPPNEKSGMRLPVAIGVILLLILGGGTLYYFFVIVPKSQDEMVRNLLQSATIEYENTDEQQSSSSDELNTIEGDLNATSDTNVEGDVNELEQSF